MAVNRCKPSQQTLVMPARLPMTMCYAIVKLIQREMQDDGLVLHLFPAQGAGERARCDAKRVALDEGVATISADGIVAVEPRLSRRSIMCASSIYNHLHPQPDT